MALYFPRDYEIGDWMFSKNSTDDKSKDRMDKLIKLKEEIYQETSPPSKNYVCPECENRSLKISIEVYSENKTTIFLQCLSCSMIDHLSLRISSPQWMKGVRWSQDSELGDQ